MKRLYRSILVLTLLLSGCSADARNIEKLNYATALGIDYFDGQYHGYVQFINLQSIGKSTDGKPKGKKTWVGEGIASSFEEALFDIYRTAQERVFWGHVTAIVISEEALKRGIDSIYDSISRYYEFRLTPWVYATRGRVDEILTTGGFFEQPTLSTILQEPTEAYTQTSFIKPIKLHRLMSNIYEPGYTVCIPSLAVNTKQWKADMKPDPKLMVEGAVFMKRDRYQSYMSLKELAGLRWVRSGTVRAAIPVPDRTDPEVQVVFDYPKTKYHLIQEGENPRFRLSMKAKGYVVNWAGGNYTSLDELANETKKAIEREIRQLIHNGQARKTDVFNLEHDLFRNHYRFWKSGKWNEKELISTKAIDQIDLRLNIVHSGTEKSKFAR
ncbi:Ger(x)C family spore germination protein [Cohnella phaseoli]|uniref:Ger(X)C family germination protein n=1 Tax=Cohnella phaseoli TaxID=456490 RepID=A0A3D9KRE1_9BACL|nr:Ger(x)C family spore germination protein [Cohnella phaseoli]RED89187.1 Ger(x)C family germination protein [Cohnella phaseoli]